LKELLNELSELIDLSFDTHLGIERKGSLVCLKGVAHLRDGLVAKPAEFPGTSLPRRGVVSGSLERMLDGGKQLLGE
jgi:hypothetical protein